MSQAQDFARSIHLFGDIDSIGIRSASEVVLEEHVADVRRYNWCEGYHR